jgi:hypothetical protein
MDGACSVIVALKSRTLRQHQKIFLLVVLMSKTFPRWAALFLSAALSEILPRPSYELQSADRWVDGCLLAYTTTIAPMANSPPLHLFARRTHPNSIPIAISPEFNA